MARTETLISPVPPGAGRFRDMVWPDPSGLDGSPSSFVGNRLGTSLVGTNPIAVSIGYGGGTSLGVASINGIDCANLPSNAGAVGLGLRFDSSMVAHIKTTLNALAFQVDDEQCFRVFCNMAMSSAPVPGTDYGWYMTTANTNGRILGDVATGFGFLYVDANTVNFISRGPLGLVQQAVTVAPFDTTQFHCYEMRITSATATTAAGLSVLIDNVPIVLPASLSSWGGVSALPPSILFGGTRAGFRPGLYNTSGLLNALFVQKLRFLSAPTMAATF
jgi:hypothetical protein